ncbi:hypothetical protein D1P53_006329 [Cryptococcus gattii VGV]|nr:hypothetical protein D1P53_006329 [Cryptococcus gattii VGV]
MPKNFDIESIVDQLTLEEACALTHGQDFWRLNGVPRLGVPAGLKVTDGPNGARGEDFVGGCTSALFPAGCSLGASFDVGSAIKIGEALARECRAKSAVALLGPTVNIHRHPAGGRNFESYSEDPYLSGVMASGYIQGLQEAGITSVTKHFVCNDSETDRRTVDVIVGEQALREIYLRPFQIAFERAGPRGVMTSYNKASYPGNHPQFTQRLLESVVRGEWGVEDLTVMSDWWGTYSVGPAIVAGMDLEMPDSFHRGNGKLLAAAQDDENLAKAVFDRARNVLRMIKRAGGYSLEPERPEAAEDLPETRQLIREVGAEGMTLLKNTGVLPLSPKTKTVVAGTYATVALAHGGGSASLDAHRKITPAEGLHEAMDEIVVVPGPVPYLYLPLPQPDVFSSSGGAGTCKVDFYNPGGKLVDSLAGWTAKMSFKLSPKTTGTHALTVASPSSAKLSINGQYLAFHKCSVNTTYTFEAGKEYDIVINYVSTEELFYSTACALNGIRFGYLEYTDDDAAIQSAVKVAEEVGTVLVCVGHGSDYETEGFDRDDIFLLGKQNAFVQALADSSAKVIVVVFAGSPIAMPWLDAVEAVVYGWFPGQELGHSLADILIGKINPSGRLPVTFPKAIEDSPAFDNFPGVNEIIKYEEGVFVGYRHYSSRQIPTLYPFGFGLSYTNFKVTDMALRGAESFGPGKKIEISVKITNTGSIAGRHTVLLFAQPPAAEDRPILSLVDFVKSSELKPQESQTLTMTIGGEALSVWEGSEAGSWVVKEGKYSLQIRDNAEARPMQSAELRIGQGWKWHGLHA